MAINKYIQIDPVYDQTKHNILIQDVATQEIFAEKMVDILAVHKLTLAGRIPTLDLVAGNNVITVAPVPAGVFKQFEATVRNNKTGEEVACRIIKEDIDTFIIQTAVDIRDVRVTWFVIE
jgi:hypothetical protein